MNLNRYYIAIIAININFKNVPWYGRSLNKSLPAWDKFNEFDAWTGVSTNCQLVLSSHSEHMSRIR